MLFESLYSLIYEQNKQEVLTFETLSKYYYHHIGPRENNAVQVNNYLKQNNIPSREAMVIIDNDDGPDPYYFFLISKVVSRSKRNKLVMQIKTVVGPTAQMRMTQYGEYPAEDIYNGSQYEFDPMDRYNLDDETKDAWRDVVGGL